MLAVFSLHLTITHDPTRLPTSQDEGLRLATYACPGTYSPEYLRLRFCFICGMALVRYAWMKQAPLFLDAGYSNFPAQSDGVSTSFGGMMGPQSC